MNSAGFESSHERLRLISHTDKYWWMTKIHIQNGVASTYHVEFGHKLKKYDFFSYKWSQNLRDSHITGCCGGSQYPAPQYLALNPAPTTSPSKSSSSQSMSYGNQCQAPCPNSCLPMGCTPSCCQAAMQQQWQMMQPQMMQMMQQPMQTGGCSPMCSMASTAMGCRRRCPSYCCNKSEE